MTSDGLALSRPLRLATQVTGDSPAEVGARLAATSVHVRLAPEYADTADATILLRSLVDQLSRFCGTVVVSAPASLVQACLDRDHELHDEPRVHAEPFRSGRPRVEVVVGHACGDVGRIATCSDGWVGKLTSNSEHLTRAFIVSNPVGAITAAALTAGEVFLRVVGIDRPPRAFELSAWTGDSGPLGTLQSGPILLTIPAIDALVVGCGNVTNGWAVPTRALQVAGHLRAVDRQSLADENLGPYALACRDMIGEPKSALLARHLHPQITVARHDEELELFVPRITRWHLPLPPLVINGLDEVEPRHVVQRLWPQTLIDMAAGGTTSQVVVYRHGEPGQCLLGAFAAPEAGPSYERRVQALTGLRPERFLADYTSGITADDVANAPPEHRSRLQAAADAGQLLCGFINRASLTAAGDKGDDDFAPAAPFVSALTGARAAALTVAVLKGESSVPGGLHWQYSFLSNRARTTVMRCPDTCECQQTRRAS